MGIDSYFSSCQACKRFRANSQNISYVVSDGKERLCSTKWTNCTFQLTSKTAKWYLSAVNAAGKSKPTKVHMLVPKGTTFYKIIGLVIYLFCNTYAMCLIHIVHTALSNVSATPHDDDRSLMVRWRSVVSSDLKGFLVEWRPLLNTDISLTQFEITDSNQTSLILKGMLSICLCILIQIQKTTKKGKHATLSLAHITDLFLLLNSTNRLL